MVFHIEERIHPHLDYAESENPISRLLEQGWGLVQLIPEYDLVECDPPRNQANAYSPKPLKVTGQLQVSNYVGVFRR
jgi:hypothetical protein